MARGSQSPGPFSAVNGERPPAPPHRQLLSCPQEPSWFEERPAPPQRSLSLRAAGCPSCLRVGFCHGRPHLTAGGVKPWVSQTGFEIPETPQPHSSRRTGLMYWGPSRHQGVDSLGLGESSAFSRRQGRVGGPGVGRCTVLSQWGQLRPGQCQWVDWAPGLGAGLLAEETAQEASTCWRRPLPFQVRSELTGAWLSLAGSWSGLVVPGAWEGALRVLHCNLPRH